MSILPGDVLCNVLDFIGSALPVAAVCRQWCGTTAYRGGWCFAVPSRLLACVQVEPFAVVAFCRRESELLDVCANLSNIAPIEVATFHGVSDAGLSHVAASGSLRSVDVSNCFDVTDAGVGQLVSLCPSLHTTSLHHCLGLTDLSAYHLTACRGLRAISFESGRFTDTSARHISQCRDLRFINFRRCGITDEALRWVSGCPFLETLDVRGCSRVTDDGVKYLSQCPSLQHLFLEDCGITDVVAQHLSQFPALQTLDLSRCQLTDTTVEHLSAGCPQLRELYLYLCIRLTDAAALSVSSFPRLERVSFNSCTNITDVGLLHLAECPSLHTLELHACERVTDVGVDYLAMSVTLHTLALSYCSVTDKCFQALSRCHSLRWVDVRGTGVTTDAVKAYFEQVPSIHFVASSLDCFWRCCKCFRRTLNREDPHRPTDAPGLIRVMLPKRK